jgi:hypothetical protein
MKKFFFSTIYIFFSITNQLISQNNENSEIYPWLSLIQIEINSILPRTDLKETIPIRQTVNNYNYYNYDQATITSTTLGHASSLKAELFHKVYKIGISTGIKYLYFQSNIKGKVSNTANYFYFRYFFEGQETRFARVKNLNEINHYVTIPIDVRVYFLSRKKIGLFARLGTDLGFNIYNKLGVVFYNPEMNPTKNEVLNILDKTQQKFYATINTSVGFRYNYIDKINFYFEVYFPSKYIGSDYFVLSDVKYFSGIKASVQMPLTLLLNRK